ncbi:hypothetical protein KL86DPRO_11124 [uncultured delta proteobacterium]|uniref:DUF5801 domain-containing protein n=1 Tax=uncultured delta proteobacterium TaxID=34034 RepID=A0A212JBU8_9DELT|nr:hypothetical protein KL86DPRO_11124 [uncultured delta proteobacterium]
MAQTTDNTIRLAQPGAGQTVNVAINADNMKLGLGFAPDPNAVAKNGQNLEFSFEDGGKIVLEGYYNHFTNKTLPTMVMESGDELPGEDFLASLREDLLTAAGPGAGAGAAGGGAGEYADDAGALVDGVGRLGSLGTIYWDRETEVEELNEALAPAAALTIAITPIIPDDPRYYMAADGFNMQIDESYMPGGSNNIDGTVVPVYQIYFSIMTNDGLAAVSIDGVLYPVVGGTLQGFPDGLSGNNGTLSNPVITLNPDGTYTLSFNYQQGGPVTHAEGGGKNIADNVDSWQIGVIGNSGVSDSLITNVDIVDDVPRVTVSVDGELPASITALVDESLEKLNGAYNDGKETAVIEADDVQALFAVVEGYDGLRSDVFSLELNADSVPSNLYAVLEGGGKSANPIVLTTDPDFPNIIFGGDVNDPHFTIEIDPDSGKITLTLLKNLWHTEGGDAHNDIETLLLGDGALMLVRTVVDNDGDDASARVDLGAAGVFNFRDDGPVIKLDPEAPALQPAKVDESLADLHGAYTDGIPSATLSIALLAKQFAVSYGADNQGVPDEYTLNLNVPQSKESIPTNLNGVGENGAAGEVIVLVQDEVTGIIYGRGEESGKDYFTLQLTAEGVKLDLLSNIWHDKPGGPDLTPDLHDEAMTLLLQDGVLTLTRTVYDGDGDSASETLDLGSKGLFQFEDDGPIVVDSYDPPETLTYNTTTNVYENETGWVQFNFGADGFQKLTVSEGNTELWTFTALGESKTVTLGDGSKLIMTLGADGNLIYTYDPAETANSHDHTFTFTGYDGDGDWTSQDINVAMQAYTPPPQTLGQIVVDESFIPNLGTQRTDGDNDSASAEIKIPEDYTLDTTGWTNTNGVMTLVTPDGKGLLTYENGVLTYTVTGSYKHGNPGDATQTEYADEGLGEGNLLSIKLNLTHDITQQKTTGTVLVDVEDDAPVVISKVDPTAQLTYNEITNLYGNEDGSLTLNYGADGFQKLTVSEGNTELWTFTVLGESKTVTLGDGSKLIMTLDADGNLKYTFDPDEKAASHGKHEFTVMAYDGDGDWIKEVFNIDVKHYDAKAPVLNDITVDESFIPGGTQRIDGTDGDSRSATAEIELPKGYTLDTTGWTNTNGVMTLVTPDGKGLLTYENGVLTYTVTGSYKHPYAGDATDPYYADEKLDTAIPITLKFTHDGTGQAVESIVQVQVEDDAPVLEIPPTALTASNTGGIFWESLGDVNWGADGQAADSPIRFNFDPEKQNDDGSWDSPLTSHDAKISYFVDENDPSILHARVSGSDDDVFTVTLHANGTYTVEVQGYVDQEVKMGGNTDIGNTYDNKNDSSYSIVLKSDGSLYFQAGTQAGAVCVITNPNGKINGNAGGIGAHGGKNQHLDAGEQMRFAFAEPQTKGALQFGGDISANFDVSMTFYYAAGHPQAGQQIPASETSSWWHYDSVTGQLVIDSHGVPFGTYIVEGEQGFGQITGVQYTIEWSESFAVYDDLPIAYVDGDGDMASGTLHLGFSEDAEASQSDSVLVDHHDDGRMMLFGGDGNEVIVGSDGDDIIYGGKGDDIMWGGDGNDIFAWKAGDLDNGTDTIMDFQIGKDHLFFENLLPTGGTLDVDTLVAMIKGDKLSIEVTDAQTLSVTVAGADNSSVTVDIHITEGSVAEYVNTTAATDQAALLLKIITDTGV